MDPGGPTRHPDMSTAFEYDYESGNDLTKKDRLSSYDHLDDDDDDD
jgi:hypothetical protein